MKSAVPTLDNPRGKNSAATVTRRPPAAQRRHAGQHTATTRADKKTEDFIAAVMGLKLKLK